MPTFQTEFDRNERVPTCSGTCFCRVYQEALDKNGKSYLMEVGKTNVYEKIQASLEETKTYNILEKFAQTGDAAILQRRECIFGDFTNIPKTPLEFQEMIMKAAAAFESLDKDVRAAFNNDVGEFKQSLLDGSFDVKVSQFKPVKQATAPVQATAPEQTSSSDAIAPTTTNGGVNLNE